MLPPGKYAVSVECVERRKDGVVVHARAKSLEAAPEIVFRTVFYTDGEKRRRIRGAIKANERKTP